MWISQKNEDSQRASYRQPTQKKRAQKTYNRVGLSFPKFLRILTKRQFQFVHGDARRIQGSFISFLYRKDCLSTRLGVTVSKKYGKAHQRNRFKRVTKEVYRLYYDRLPAGVMINVYPKLPRRDIDFRDIATDFELLVETLSC